MGMSFAIVSSPGMHGGENYTVIFSGKTPSPKMSPLKKSLSQVNCCLLKVQMVQGDYLKSTVFIVSSVFIIIGMGILFPSSPAWHQVYFSRPLNAADTRCASTDMNTS